MFIRGDVEIIGFVSNHLVSLLGMIKQVLLLGIFLAERKLRCNTYLNGYPNIIHMLAFENVSIVDVIRCGVLRAVRYYNSNPGNTNIITSMCILEWCNE